MATWLVYALGGGWGHLNRAIALGRQAATQHHVRILTNSPYAPWVETQLHQIAFSQSVLPNLSLQILPTASFTETRHQVQRIIQNKNYDCLLIVDTFPRGLGGELVDCLPSLSSIPTILIHRDIDPAYVQAKQVGQFVEAYYDTILIPGEGDDVPFADFPQAVHTEPWVILNAPELPPVLPTEKPTLVVVAAGNLEEMAFWGQLMVQLQATFSETNCRCLAYTCPPGCPPHLWIQQWPGLPVLHQADVVIGGAGYNTVFECCAIGKPLIALAWPRQYDRQWHRGQQWAQLVETPQASIAAVKDLLQASRNPNQIQLYRNGIGDAIAIIDKTYSAP